LIEIQYYQACDALLSDDEHCVLVRDHEGEHALTRVELPTEFEVEV
jgi:hypothetical protein